MEIYDFDNGVYILESSNEENMARFIVRQEFPQIYCDDIIAIVNTYEEAKEIAEYIAETSSSNILTEDELYDYEDSLLAFD